MAAQAEIEDVTQDLLVCLTNAATVLEHLAGALGDAGLHAATHIEIFQLLGLLRGLLAEHAVDEDHKPKLGDIADWVRHRGDRGEE
jgi:hypothetical protein